MWGFEKISELAEGYASSQTTGVIAVGRGLRCAGPFAGHRRAGDSWRDRA